MRRLHQGGFKPPPLLHTWAGHDHGPAASGVGASLRGVACCVLSCLCDGESTCITAGTVYLPWVWVAAVYGVPMCMGLLGAAGTQQVFCQYGRQVVDWFMACCAMLCHAVLRPQHNDSGVPDHQYTNLLYGVCLWCVWCLIVVSLHVAAQHWVLQAPPFCPHVHAVDCAGLCVAVMVAVCFRNRCCARQGRRRLFKASVNDVGAAFFGCSLLLSAGTAVAAGQEQYSPKLTSQPLTGCC